MNNLYISNRSLYAQRSAGETAWYTGSSEHLLNTFVISAKISNAGSILAYLHRKAFEIFDKNKGERTLGHIIKSMVKRSGEVLYKLKSKGFLASSVST